ncbi:MAG TPA: farnesyl diphosphate synthase [Candidatus Obscuribacterales bacterium]
MCQITPESQKQAQAEVESALARYMQPVRPTELWEAMHYSVLGGGKRIRPLLCLFSCEAVGGKRERALAAACAIELIHTYSLIHDDLPALDNDDWRRGRASNHRVHGEALAILAGDALLALAFEILAQAADGPAAVQVRVMAELAQAAGPGGMCAGQVLDMQGAEAVQTADEILEVYQLKTGALIRAAVRMGALLGGGNPAQLQALTLYAEALGQAFQLVDDLLDLTGSLDSLGKTPGKDLVQQKRTYPALLGMDATRRRVNEQLQAALGALQLADLARTDSLAAMAHLLVERTT